MLDLFLNLLLDLVLLWLLWGLVIYHRNRA
jgi:hypothetical protein